MRFVSPVADVRRRYRLLAAVAIVVGVIALAQKYADAEKRTETCKARAASIVKHECASEEEGA